MYKNQIFIKMTHNEVFIYKKAFGHFITLMKHTNFSKNWM